MSYADRLEEIAANDAKVLFEKDREYGGSWLKRGGIGAFMMACRKWDRLENAMSTEICTPRIGHFQSDSKSAPLQKVTGGELVDKFDIIKRALADGREEGILDDIGDLRRYLLLIEAEIREQQSK